MPAKGTRRNSRTVSARSTRTRTTKGTKKTTANKRRTTAAGKRTTKTTAGRRRAGATATTRTRSAAGTRTRTTARTTTRTTASRTPTTRSKTAKRTPNAAFMRPYQPDDALAPIVGHRPIPRTQVTKKLWAYIKKNGLQDATQRRIINADAALRDVFDGKQRVDMFQMTKLVSRHLIDVNR